MDPAIPAATLIVLRPAPAGLEVLMVERGARMAFAGGALVFPGGRVDAADHAFADRLGRPDAAPQVAAVRETIEESAVAPALLGPLDPALGASLQQALLNGTDFAALLDSHGLALDPGALTPFTRWMPAFQQTRRFDTHFFLAVAPTGDWHPLPQPGECQSAEWATPAAFLTRIAAGDRHAIFPTKRNLERLARFATVEEARADAAAHSLDTIVPWVEQRDGAPHVCIPPDRGYPVTSEPLATAFRA